MSMARGRVDVEASGAEAVCNVQFPCRIAHGQSISDDRAFITFVRS